MKHLVMFFGLTLFAASTHAVPFGEICLVKIAPCQSHLAHKFEADLPLISQNGVTILNHEILYSVAASFSYTYRNTIAGEWGSRVNSFSQAQYAQVTFWSPWMGQASEAVSSAREQCQSERQQMIGGMPKCR